MSLFDDKIEDIVMSVRTVQPEGSQLLLKVKEVEISNIDVKVIHNNGDTNIATFTSPASIYLMVGKNTIDHIKK